MPQKFLTSMMHDEQKPNHLKGQSSPYLLQHQNNPVDWYPWCKEALAKAVDEDKPLLVSIGYSACHWCHVMEKESFEDQEVAEIMNNHFVCIKVDREERPDIDHMYMTAVQLLTRQGGWPLNCFALPDTRPFWGGTYFPREQWKNILLQVAGLYESQKDDLVDQAEKITRGVADSNFIGSDGADASFGQIDADNIFRNIMDHMDKEEGGTLNAPKFPLPGNLELLLHYFYHTGDTSALDQVELSLKKMAMGGIYDQIGGGFARYSTDELWKVPHFEKMLYDNGQLVSVYSRAWSVLKVPLFKDVVYQTIEFIARELTSPEGAFFSALDADSEGEEGKYYVWNEEEIDSLLGEDSPLFKEYYQVGKKGYWEGNNILLRDDTDKIYSEKMNISSDELQVFIKKANKILLDARSGRVRPGLDNKVIVSWNALMISGLADAYAAFGENSFLHKATKAAGYIIKHSIDPDGKMYRSLSAKSASIDGFLEDYAFFIYSLIRLYEVSMKKEYLLQARTLAEYVIENFTSSDTSLFSFSSVKGEKLMADIFEIQDNVLPSSNSVMALNLLYLSEYFEAAGWARRSYQMLTDIRQRMFSYGPGFFNWGRLLFHNVYPFYSFVVSGPDAAQSIKEISALYLPAKLVSGATSDAPEIPVLKNRFREGETWYYVCARGRCKMPVQELEPALIQIIANENPLT